MIRRYSMSNIETKKMVEHILDSDLQGPVYLRLGRQPVEEIFDEIQKSNLSKLGEDGKPIYRNDGKVMKGPNYFKPDISKVLN